MCNFQRSSEVRLILARLTFVFALILSGGAALRAQEPAPSRSALSLNDAVLLALARNPDLLNAHSAEDQAALSVRVAESAFSVKVLPSLFGAAGTATLANQSYGVTASKKFATGTEVRGQVISTSYQNQLGPYFNSDTTLQVTQPLLRGFGRTVVGRNVADATGRLEVSRAQATFAEQQLAVDVSAAYYMVVVQGRVANAARSALEKAQGLRDASAALLVAGRVSQLDVLRAEQLASQTQARVIDADDALADARDWLSLLIGRSLAEPIQVRDDIPVALEPMPDVTASVEAAERNRPEIVAARNAIAEQDRAVAAARSQLRPQVDLGFQVTRRETAPTLGASFGLDGFGPNGFVNVSMPLERTAEEAALQGAQTERQNRLRALEMTRDRIALDVKQATRRRIRAVTSLGLARTSVSLAEQEMEVASFRFQRGLSNNLDSIAAQTTYREAQAQEIAAQAEAEVSRIALRAAVGVLDPRRDFR